MNDKLIRQDIIAELDFEPSINSANIGVAVDHGLVTLTGHVPNYAQKSLAEAAVKRVKGVRGVAEELKVDLGPSNPYSDDDIAKRALTVVDLNVLIPSGKIQVKVEKGWLTLFGQVDWDYQRMAAIEDLKKLRGVMGISNNITVAPHATLCDVERHITDALKRSAAIEAGAIRVMVLDGKVVLEGEVDSWTDRKTIERAAWSVPGVRAVEDHVRVM